MTQMILDFSQEFPSEVYDYGLRTSREAHGVVLTKPHIVDLILDLAGYEKARDLAMLRLLEPACGCGVFLIGAVERLMQSAKAHARRAEDLYDAVRAFEIDPEHVETSKAAVTQKLQEHGLDAQDSKSLADEWIIEGDFLLADSQEAYDVIVGNPPYIRIEQIHPILQRAYRSRFETLTDRADLYIAFIEHGLRLLGPEGVLTLICADRWTLNKYGAPLRRLLTENFKVRHYLDLHQASPFDSEVNAYPSIFSVGRGSTDQVRVGRMTTASPAECEKFRRALKGRNGRRQTSIQLSDWTTWFRGEEPWVISSSQQLEALRDLEERFPRLEQSGRTRVGIGVATGSDRIYIVKADEEIEKDRLVPLVMRRDLRGGMIDDAGRYVINPFLENGGLVDLKEYPKLAEYFQEHAEPIRKRHVARKNPDRWFRTIDRIYPKLVDVPKLLIPDIAGANEVVYDAGRYYPHHNLYFVTSEDWDLEVLGGLLSTRVALFFVWSYAVKMRGGYLRFQAQYLRRIRVPNPMEVPGELARAIRQAYRRRDFERLDELALKAYSIKELPEFDFVDTRR